MSERFFPYHEEKLDRDSRNLTVNSRELTENPEEYICSRFNRLFSQTESLDDREYQKRFSSLTRSLFDATHEAYLYEAEFDRLRSQIWINYALAHYLKREEKHERREKKENLDDFLSAELENALNTIYLQSPNIGRSRMQEIQKICTNLGKNKEYGQLETGIKGVVSFARAIQQQGERRIYIPDPKSDVLDKMDLVLTTSEADRSRFQDWEDVPVRDWPDSLKSQIYAVQVKCSSRFASLSMRYFDRDEPLADFYDKEADRTGIEVHQAWKDIGISGFYVEIPAQEINADFDPSAEIQTTINQTINRKEAEIYASAA